MRDVLKFLLFLIYTVLIFFIKDIRIIAIITVINILLMVIFKINFKDTIKNIYKVLWFILFTVVINIIFSDVQNGILIGIRLILVCNITYIFSKFFTYIQLAKTIENICKPLQILHINTKQIGLIICIAIAFIPILQAEIYQIRLSLISKGKRNSITIMFQVFLANTFKRINYIEESIKSKGWDLE